MASSSSDEKKKKKNEHNANISSNDHGGCKSTGHTSASSVAAASAAASWTMQNPFALVKQQWEEFSDQQRIDRLKSCQVLDGILQDCRQKQQAQKKKHGRKHHRDHDHAIDTAADPIESVTIGIRKMKYFGWRGIVSSSSSSSSDNNSSYSDESTEENDSNNIQDNTIEMKQHKKKQQLEHNKEAGLVSEQLIQSRIRESCSREEHAVWACRAIATGCGQDLSLLKRCFEEGEHEHEHEHNYDYEPKREKKPFDKYSILTAPCTNYEGIIRTTNDDDNNHAENSTAAGGVVKDSYQRRLKQRIPCYAIQQRLGSCVTQSGTQLLQRKQQREEKEKSHRITAAK